MAQPTWLDRFDAFSHQAVRFYAATGRIFPASFRRLLIRAAAAAAGGAGVHAIAKLFT